MKLESAEFAFKANRKVPPSGDLGDHLIMPVQRTFVSFIIRFLNFTIHFEIANEKCMLVYIISYRYPLTFRIASLRFIIV
jgi:hypothetical protein